MKLFISSLLVIIFMTFICSDIHTIEKFLGITSQQNWYKRSPQQVEVFTLILDIKVFAVAILPDSTEVIVKNFETLPLQSINQTVQISLSSIENIKLDIQIKGIAYVTIATDTGLKILKLPYLMQRKGDLISPTCGNSFPFAKI